MLKLLAAVILAQKTDSHLIQPYLMHSAYEQRYTHETRYTSDRWFHNCSISLVLGIERLSLHICRPNISENKSQAFFLFSPDRSILMISCDSEKTWAKGQKDVFCFDYAMPLVQRRSVFHCRPVFASWHLQLRISKTGFGLYNRHIMLFID